MVVNVGREPLLPLALLPLPLVLPLDPLLLLVPPLLELPLAPLLPLLDPELGLDDPDVVGARVGVAWLEFPVFSSNSFCCSCC